MADPMFNSGDRIEVEFYLNGTRLTAHVDPMKRLSETLRDEFGLTGVKIGCDAGDCGACTVLLSGKQACACMTPTIRVHDRSVVTVEGMGNHGVWSRLQQALWRHGAAQCGICMPGMIMAAAEVIGTREAPTAEDVMDAMGGVLCRCTGYRKILTAVLDNLSMDDPATAEFGRAVGARVTHLDGRAKLNGEAMYGADSIPENALWLKIIRSPHASAEVRIGDLDAFVATRPGLRFALTAADVPGRNAVGIFPDVKDQPVLAEDEVRYRGDPVIALVGEKDAIADLDDSDLPIEYVVRTASIDMEAALSGPPLHEANPDNILTRGLVNSGDVGAALSAAAQVASGRFETSFVEHVYIEPEAGYAVREGDRVDIFVTTQAPYLDLEETAAVLGLPMDQVRIIPTACGGGFGGKLDLSVQPLIALAAWRSDRPVACVYSRPESMAASTKRHPASIEAKLGCDAEGRLTALDFAGDFNTGAYASWGATVAGRVPVHASGPYRVPHVHAKSRAIYTNNPPAGAFRGFGVPQSAIAQECLMDELAAKLDIDPLEFRYRNALRVGDRTASGQALKASAGLPACLDALRDDWRAYRQDVDEFNAAADGPYRRGAGIAAMWYGIGNTGLPNPSTMRIGLRRNGRLMLYNGAVDIGQGSSTILAQIAADAIGVDLDRIDQIVGDTGATADAGKTSASRQTYVSGRAMELAGQDLRGQILRLANAGENSILAFGDHELLIRDNGQTHRIDLSGLAGSGDDVLLAEATFDPDITGLDANGQGTPYATYAFGAQIALVEVDVELGRTRVLKMTAAHDVGKAVNPTLVEGQIEGAIAQGIGLALMEEYVPGETEDLHNYLIPTFGDMPDIKVLLIEDPEPSGPFGAKGVGEPGLVATAPAVFAAIKQATGITVRKAPATPARLHAAIRALAEATP